MSSSARANPRCAWMTDEGMYTGFEAVRMNAWRDLTGAQYGEDYFIYSTVPVTLAPGISSIQSFQIEADSGFEWIAATATGVSGAGTTFGVPGNLNVTALIADGGSSRNLSNAAIPLGLLAGMGQFPQFLPVSRRFMPSSTVQVTLNNYDTATTMSQVQLNLIGRKIFNLKRPDLMGRAMPQFRKWTGFDGATYTEDFYTYVFSTTALQTAAIVPSVPVTNLIEADSDFEWILTQQCSIARNATTGNSGSTGLFTLQVTDGGSGRALFFNPVNAASMSGINGQVYINPVPRVFLGRTPVTWTIVNTDTVTLNQIFIAMMGRKIFRLD